jgi:hypothetical protein
LCSSLKDSRLAPTSGDRNPQRHRKGDNCTLAATARSLNVLSLAVTVGRNLKMTRPRIILLAISIACSACNDYRKLGDGYFLLPKYEAIDVGYPNAEAILYKSTEAYSFDEIIIAGDVIEVDHNSKFIVANRNPLIEWKTNSGQLEYYLIIKENDSLIGPLSRTEYEETKEELQVELELK